MTITTIGVGAHVTPTVIKTYLFHYANRAPRRQKPTAHISYDEAFHLIKSFLEYASHHTIEDIQAFTAQWVPSPSWVRTEGVVIPASYIGTAADTLIAQLGEEGLNQVGGRNWWQWRRKNAELKAEWIEMRADFNARKQLQEKSRRVMLYVHGGAYFFGSVDEHRYQMQRHARKLKARVFAPRYRLAPQFPFPCGLQDCLATYLYLLSVHDTTEIVLAGDSAGGGMVTSMLCILRDQGLPLPASAILISPWVDLTHSFPSVAGSNEFDYIPAHGFMQKPSVSWPPPNDQDMEAIRKGAGGALLQEKQQVESGHPENASAQAATEKNALNGNSSTVAQENLKQAASKSAVPGPSRHLSINLDGKNVELKDQIQMYATNQLISHPLVSPVLQPSLGGLPPILILTGGGEVLRDEQIYLAHKAAHPEQYPLVGDYQKRYDPNNDIYKKYPPTPVQLQVWEDLCHVAPTLSFTRPAKYMYRSIAQFGAWSLARAQHAEIEIVDDDEISVISSDSDTESTAESVQKPNVLLARRNTKLGNIGKAGDPIPAFKNHMIRQRVDRNGNIFPLDPPSALPAMQMNAADIGVIKPGPVRKWLEAKQQWDTKYARTKRRVQQNRIKDLAQRKGEVFDGEQPPPSALAGRQHEESKMITGKLKKSFGLAMWSGWGSKHDEDTIRREEEMNKNETEDVDEIIPTPDGMTELKKKKSGSHSRTRIGSKPAKDGKFDDRSRSRRRTVRDAGQVEGADDQPEIPTAVLAEATEEDSRLGQSSAAPERANSVEHLTPLFIPKFKTSPHLRSDSETASVRTGATIPDNASTMAVFAAAGVARENAESALPNNERAKDTDADSDRASTIRLTSSHARPASALGGYDTPVSRRSVERLMSHQIDVTNPDGETASVLSANPFPTDGQANGSGRPGIANMRTTSSMAVVQAEGVIPALGSQDGNETSTAGPDGSSNKAATDHAGSDLERPGMYDRAESDFQTAMESL